MHIDPRSRSRRHVRRLAVAGAALAAAVATAAAVGPAAVGKSVPSCVPKGATLHQAQGDVRIVRTVLTPRRGQTARERYDGCLASRGTRFKLTERADHGDDLTTRLTFTVVGGRYIGMFEEFVGGVSESRKASTFDARTRKALHTSQACDAFDAGDFGGAREAAFLPGGSLAIACDGASFVIDKKGERALEPAGTAVAGLAVSDQGELVGTQLYWTVRDSAGKTVTVKSASVSSAGTVTPN